MSSSMKILLFLIVAGLAMVPGARAQVRGSQRLSAMSVRSQT